MCATNTATLTPRMSHSDGIAHRDLSLKDQIKKTPTIGTSSVKPIPSVGDIRTRFATIGLASLIAPNWKPRQLRQTSAIPRMRTSHKTPIAKLVFRPPHTERG